MTTIRPCTDIPFGCSTSGRDHSNTAMQWSPRQRAFHPNTLCHPYTNYLQEHKNEIQSLMRLPACISQEYRHLLRTLAKKVWETALESDLGRLAYGMGTQMPKGKNTIQFISRQAVPHHKNSRLVAELRPHKNEVQMVQVGD